MSEKQQELFNYPILQLNLHFQQSLAHMSCLWFRDLILWSRKRVRKDSIAYKSKRAVHLAIKHQKLTYHPI